MDYVLRNVLITVSVAFGFALGIDPLCGDALLQSLPNDHLSASSFRDDGAVESQAHRGRLYTTEGTLNNGTIQLGAWAPTSNDLNQYIEAMFDETIMITGLLNQGRHLSDDYVTHYKVQYTEDGTTWQTLNNDIGVENIFMGNSDGDSIVENEFECAIFVKGIRLIPMGWNNHIAMRFDINGCYLDNTVVVVTTTVPPVGLPNSTTAPFLPGIQTPFGGTGKASVTHSTINMLTLIQWFKTGLSHNTTPTKSTTTTSRQTTTTIRTTTATTTAKPTIPPFRPGILNPFGTSVAPVAG